MLNTKFTRGSLRLSLATILCTGFAVSALAIYIPPGETGSWQASSSQDCDAVLTCMEYVMDNGAVSPELHCMDTSTLDFENPAEAGFRHDH
ncbi:MAG: hypothetical protein K0U98_19845 [Deltaproteobacteria bacterium]|nr:hypothetical protein [Deltaproteobacteria bacterium]